MTPKIIEAAEAEPLTIAECRAHLNIYAYETDSDGNTTHPDDAMIMAMLASAREQCENFTGRAITRKTYEIALDEFPDVNPQFRPYCRPYSAISGRNGAIELPMPPLVSVVSVMLGTDSDALMIENTDYIVDDYCSPARILPVTYWPSVTASINLIKIRYIAGYGTDSDGDIALPGAIRAAILLTLGTLYANRENDRFTQGSVLTLPNGVESLLRPYRVWLGMA